MSGIAKVRYSRSNFQSNIDAINSCYSGHLRDVVLCPEKREPVILGVMFSQTSIDGDPNFVRNNGVSARRELTVRVSVRLKQTTIIIFCTEQLSNCITEIK